MTRMHRYAWLGAVSVLMCAPMVRAADVETRLHEAYFLHHSQGDYAKAAAVYEELAASGDLSTAVRAKVDAELSACRAALQTSNFARLMPADAMVYAEVRNAGQQIADLTRMLGLVGSPTPSGRMPADDVNVPVPNPEFAISRMRISPALLRELEKMGSIAFAQTAINPDGIPEGLGIIDPGRCDLVRGMLEMGIPILTPIGEIEGWPAYGIENVAVVITERLILVGAPRVHAVEAAKALRAGRRSNSLADDPAFQRVADWREHSMIFGYVDAQKVLPVVLGIIEAGGLSGDDRQMIQAARGMLDLDHVRSAAFRAGVTETGISADLGIQLADGHQSLALHFTRTPPLSRESLRCVPEGAVGAVAFALAEADAKYASGVAANGAAPSITGLDFGREIFANIEEIALFVMPPGTPGPGSGAPRIDGQYVPDAGIAITVKDPAQSDALWSQLLAIPTLILGPSKASTEPVSVEGRTVSIHRFPENVQLAYASMENHILLGTSERAVGRMIRARRSGESILTDDAFRTVTAGLGDNASKLVMVHAARASQLAASYAPSEAAVPLRLMVPNVCKDLVVCGVTHESPTELTVHAAVENLPDLSVLLNQIQNITEMVGGGMRKQASPKVTTVRREAAPAQR